MTIYRAAAVFEGTSGLPKDRTVNTFHFEGSNEAADPQHIIDVVWAFYFSPAGANVALQNFLSEELVTQQIKVYKVADDIGEAVEAPAGPPIKLGGVQIVEPAGAEISLPRQVAVTLSFDSTNDPGIHAARRRGRIAFGPLNALAKADSGVGGQPIPSVAVRQALRQAGDKMATDAAAQGLTFVVYSRPYPGRAAIPRVDKPDLPALPARVGNVYSVDRFSTTDTFTTQRRRLLQATARTYELVG